MQRGSNRALWAAAPLLLGGPAAAQAGLTDVARIAVEVLALEYVIMEGEPQLPRNACDGDPEQAWVSSMRPDGWHPVFLRVLLPDSYEILEFGIRWGSHEHDYVIEVSEDNLNWYLVHGPAHSANAEGAAPVHESIAVAPVQARYARLRLFSTSAPAGDPMPVEVVDFEIYVEDCNLNGIPDAQETGNDWNANGVPDDCEAVAFPYCTPQPNSATWSGGRLELDGSLSLADGDLTLSVRDCPANVPGVVFYGPQKIEVPFGGGTLCVGGAMHRLAPVLTDALGMGSVPLDLDAAPLGAGPGQLEPLVPTSFQFWFRDPAAGGGSFNFTDALSVTLRP